MPIFWLSNFIPSKIDFVAQGKALDYENILVFLHSDSVSLNQTRISQRASEGGIPFPMKKYEAGPPGC